MTGRWEGAVRVLFLADYFPKPGNPIMGTWALAQAQALLRRGMDIRVVSFTPWVPRILALTRGSRAFASCPVRQRWGDLSVDYPRWHHYPVGPGRAAGRWAPLQMRLAWLTARRELLRLVAEHRTQVIYAHHSLPNGYLAWHLKRLLSLPYVVTDHSFDEVQACERHPQRRMLSKLVGEGASTLVAVTKALETDLRRICPNARIRTIYNGVDPISPEVLNQPRP